MTSISKTVYHFVKRILATPEYFFVLSTAFFGMILLLIVPPFQTPDENIHFYRAYEVSEFKRPKNNNGESGNYLPRSIRETELQTHAVYGDPGTPGQIMFNSNEKYDYRYTKAALFNIPLDSASRTFYKTSGSPDYMPLSYAPQAAAVAIARIFEAPIIIQLYLVRSINLVVWITLAYYGIKKFPFKKWSIAAICLLPVVMGQAISPGLDPLVFGSSLIFITIILNLIINNKTIFTLKHFIVIIVLSLIMVFAKSSLIVFLLLILLIPKHKFKNYYSIIVKLLLILLPIFSYLVWSAFLGGSGDGSVAASSSLQWKSVIYEPLHFFHLLFNTMFLTTPSGNLLVQSMVGNFGWLDTPMSPVMVAAGYAIISLILLSDYEKFSIKHQLGHTRIVLMLLLSAAYLGATFLAMYVYFTLPQDNHIKGVNGRYFVPLLFLMVPSLSLGILKMSKPNYIKFVQISTIFLMIVAIFTIFSRYYLEFHSS